MTPHLKYILYCTFALLASGCDVHEFPDASSGSDSNTDVVLHLDYSLELPPYKEIGYAPSTGRADGSVPDRRYIVTWYHVGSRDEVEAEPAGNLIFTKPADEEPNQDFLLSLPADRYLVMVWTDYVSSGETTDLYYDTSVAGYVTVGIPYCGNNDFRDAFRGRVMLDLTSGPHDVTVAMERPLGKYRLVATDFDIFLSRAEEFARSHWERSRAGNPLSAPSEMPPVNLSDYRVEVSYPVYMPHVFDLLNNRPCDSRTGVKFHGSIRRVSQKEAELGFDYVFVNGKELKVTVKVDIYDPNGTNISSSGAIDLPLIRSGLTTVRGEFLTSKASGGVGINPGFDNDINIIIP